MKILPAAIEDLEAILHLQKECYLSEGEIHNDYNIPPLTQDLQSMEYDFYNKIILKGEIEGKIIASIRGHAENGTCYIGKMAVQKQFQNKGLGQLLMASMESRFKESKRYELFTGYKSVKNLYLYNKLGYKEFKREVIHKNLTLVYLEKFCDLN